MEYYQSTRPPVDDSGLSGGVSFAFDGQIATTQVGASGGLPFYVNDPNNGLDNQTPNLTTYTIQICVDGVPMNLDVYVSGPPYPIPS